MPTTRLTDFSVVNLTAFNEGVLFSRAGSGQQDQLWISDGTTAGTEVLKDPGGNDSSRPSYLTVVGGTLLFAADDGSNGRELWRSDGTTSGTLLVKDVNTGAPSGLPRTFSAGYRYVTAVNGTLFFAGTTASGGTELWKSDGTAAGTVLVKDIYDGSDAGVPNSSQPYQLTPFGHSLLFVARDARNGLELWKSDGSTTGTVLLKDIYGGAYDSEPDELTVAGASLFFAASDTKNGRELWKSDGTSRGTVLVANLNPTSGGGYGYGCYPHDLTAVGSSLFFLADSGGGDALWISDGSAAGTRKIGMPTGFSDAADLTALGTSLYFVATDSSGDRELWTSDGSAAGTVRVANINPNGSSAPTELTQVGDSLFFTANDGSNGRELWRYSPSSGTAAMVVNLRSGAGDANPSALTVSGGDLYFNASGDGVSGLWRIDDLPTDNPPQLQQVTISGGSALLTLDQPVLGRGGSLNATFFQVLVGGVAVKATAAGLDLNGTLLTLTLASAPAATAITEVFYAPPAGAVTGTLVALNGGRAMEPQSINGAISADSFRSSASVSGLADPYRSLELLGTLAINGTANAGANLLRGNSAVNVLNGLAGRDDIDGRDGGDIYLVTSAGDHGDGSGQAAEFRDTGSSGSDEVRFAATSTTGGSRLTLFAAEIGLERVVIGTGSGSSASTSGGTELEVDASAIANALTLIGNDGANRLLGTAHADTLIGNKGNDSLTGGGGADSFVFNQAPGSANRDTLTDFTVGTDKLTFSKAVYKALGTGSGITTAQLLQYSGPSPIQTANSRLLFNTSTAVLSYDADGSGSRSTPVEVAQLTGVTGLGVSDVLLIA